MFTRSTPFKISKTKRIHSSALLLIFCKFKISKTKTKRARARRRLNRIVAEIRIKRAVLEQLMLIEE